MMYYPANAYPDVVKGTHFSKNLDFTVQMNEEAIVGDKQSLIAPSNSVPINPSKTAQKSNTGFGLDIFGDTSSG